MKNIMCRVLMALFSSRLFYLPAASTETAADNRNLTGTWIGYYDDGSKSPYVWSIQQTGPTLSIKNVGGETAKPKGHIDGDKVVAEDFATQNGKLSADGSKITWTDGVVWKRAPKSPDLSGNWIGYYADGSKSPYVWSIQQTGSTLSIKNVGGETAKSKGHIEGDKVVAEDFATKNGKLSADGSKITWTDGVTWVKK